MTLQELDMNKTYTYADYFRWKLEERVELIRGRIFEMSPAPSRRQQQISGNIFYELKQFVQRGPCEVYSAPFDVRLPRKSASDIDITTVLQPDVCVVCDASKLDEKGCVGAPDIVVEVLSPGNNAKELKNKYEVYEEAGVPEYWVVSPQDETVLVYTLTGGKYTASRMMVAGDSVHSTVLNGFSLDVARLFE